MKIYRVFIVIIMVITVCWVLFGDTDGTELVLMCLVTADQVFEGIHDIRKNEKPRRARTKVAVSSVLCVTFAVLFLFVSI
ncbi:hypothetical protein [Salibacterium sp. K-3]